MPVSGSLGLSIDTRVPNYPTVRLLVDGQDVLDPDRQEVGNDPADLLDTGALLPRADPHRIAFYGCGCGIFGCSCVSGLISQEGGLVRWTHFTTLTGVFHSALPPAEYDVPAFAHAGARLDLPELSFDADEYRSTIEEATADRSWETRPRAVVRLMRQQRPSWPHWATHRGESVAVHHRVDAMNWTTELEVPPGPVQRLADALVDLLDRYDDPREIAARGLWR